MRSSLALSALILLGTVSTQQSFLNDDSEQTHSLEQTISRIIRMNIYSVSGANEKYVYTSKFDIGGANQTMYPNRSSLNTTNVNLLIDTRN